MVCMYFVRDLSVSLTLTMIRPYGGRRTSPGSASGTKPQPSVLFSALETRLTTQPGRTMNDWPSSYPSNSCSTHDTTYTTTQAATPRQRSATHFMIPTFYEPLKTVPRGCPSSHLSKQDREPLPSAEPSRGSTHVTQQTSCGNHRYGGRILFNDLDPIPSPA
jgi:hypothetical protein